MELDFLSLLVSAGGKLRSRIGVRGASPPMYLQRWLDLLWLKSLPLCVGTRFSPSTASGSSSTVSGGGELR
jgi:hypothetical protein